MTSATPLFARTVRVQVYLPQWLADKFFEYLRTHNLSRAEGGRHAVRQLVQASKPSTEVLVAQLEERLAATVERSHGDQLQLIEEVRQSLVAIHELVDALRTRA